jgi:hypothetical protein
VEGDTKRREAFDVGGRLSRGGKRGLKIGSGGEVKQGKGREG